MTFFLPEHKAKQVGEPLPWGWEDKMFWPITIIGNMVGLLVIVLIFIGACYCAGWTG